MAYIDFSSVKGFGWDNATLGAEQCNGWALLTEVKVSQILDDK